MVSCFLSCAREPESRLEQIWAEGKITVITDNNEQCYFMYKDAPAGFEYDMARAFADYLTVDLQVISPGWEEMFEVLDKGRGDFIAASLTRLPEREARMDFSDEYLVIQQFIIVHKDNRTVGKIEDLNGKTIHVRAATSYQQRLNRLKESGIDIEIVLHKNIPTEDLLSQVADKKIEITVADTNVAILNRRFYPAIRMAFSISEPQALGWAVSKGDTALAKIINRFFSHIMANGTYDKIYERYYAATEIFDYVDLVKFHQRLESRLPKYEAIIRREADHNGFDWRLLAAIIYQESHFNPHARSYTGVRGLMQLTLETAQEMGVKNRLDPEDSIRGGARYLNLLFHRFDDVEDDFDRMLLALAAYNVGYGHVRDAQRIAEKLGSTPRQWNAVKKTLPLLNDPKYYRFTRHGYARGTEPVRYVDRITTYLDVLRRTYPG
jgi:membrane-bound lytic murein transglycosylase F